MCVCVCVCVCVCDNTERERESTCMHVCMRARVCVIIKMLRFCNDIVHNYAYHQCDLHHSDHCSYHHLCNYRLLFRLVH